MKTAIYPGSFDPITYGHLDIIDRATTIFDKVIVAVAHNETKEPLLSSEDRMAHIRDSTYSNKKIEVDEFSGLLVNYAASKKALVIIRGLRAVSDFEYEMQMALMNRRLMNDVVTVFLMPNEKYTYLHSSIVREIAQYGGDISNFVSPMVAEQLQKIFKKN
jgi:pantetheine-phosphate adenylyltransferase